MLHILNKLNLVGKKIFTWGALLWLKLISNFTFADNPFFYTTSEEAPTVDLAATLSKDSVTNSDSLLNKLLKLFQLSDASWFSEGTSKTEYYIKWIVSMSLSFVSLISLILTIYAFYLMFFSGNEEGFTKSKKILKGVIIAVSIMGLSWFIVRFLFDTHSIITE